MRLNLADYSRLLLSTQTSRSMKSFKVTISLLLLSSVSALAVETPVPIAESSLPMIAAITSASKPAVDGMNGKVSVFGGAGQGNIIGLAGLPGFSPGYYTNEYGVWTAAGEFEAY